MMIKKQIWNATKSLEVQHPPPSQKQHNYQSPQKSLLIPITGSNRSSFRVKMGQHFSLSDPLVKTIAALVTLWPPKPHPLPSPTFCCKEASFTLLTNRQTNGRSRTISYILLRTIKIISLLSPHPQLREMQEICTLACEKFAAGDKVTQSTVQQFLGR